MHARDQFDFDSIACPNSFEDDPEVDVFFDRIIRSSKREVLRKSALINNTSTVRTRKVSLAESARKNIQNKAQSFREKFLPRRKTKPVAVADEKNTCSVPEQITPVCQAACKKPLVPPRTRRVGSRSKAVAPENTPNQKCVKRHAWGRWSFPPAEPLTYNVDPEDVKQAQSTPLRSKKVANAQRTKTVDSTVTPRRKKSVTKATRIRFEARDSLRKASLRKSIAKIPKTSKIPIPRKPYANVKSKVGEIIRSVLPSRPKPAASMMAVKVTQMPEKKTAQLVRNYYQAGKTLAQLVKEFQRAPRQYSDDKFKPKDNRAAWKTYF